MKYSDIYRLRRNAAAMLQRLEDNPSMCLYDWGTLFGQLESGLSERCNSLDLIEFVLGEPNCYLDAEERNFAMLFLAFLSTAPAAFLKGAMS